MANDKLVQILRDCTVRVTLDGKSVLGTGFFVSPGLILTCAHVMDALLSSKEMSTKIFWRNREYQAQVVQLLPKPYPDIALLGIESLMEHQCVFLNTGMNVGDEVYTYGFTDEYPDGDSAQLTYEGPTILNEGQDQNNIMFKLKSGQVRPGFSGAPLLNLRTGCVCGIIKSTRDREIDLGGRAIPVSTVLAKLPYLVTQQHLYHQNATVWLDELSQTQKEEIKTTSRIHEPDLPQQPRTANIQARLMQQVERLTSRFISGSSRITVGNLLNSESDLFIRFRWRSSKSGETEKGDIADYILDTIPDALHTDRLEKHQKILILSDPGFGKSTLTYSVFCELADRFRAGNSIYVPIYINLQDYIGDDEFGTKDWVTNLLSQLAEGENISWAEIRELDSSPRLVPYIILDALDEFLSGFSLNEVYRVLKRFIFGFTSVITCRRAYYERYLFMSDFAQSFERLYLLDWTKNDTDKYTRSYYRFCFSPKEAEALAVKARKSIEKSLHLRELCQVPLRLNMTLELLSDSGTEPTAIIDLNSLYYTYVFNWLAREASKVNSVLSVEEKYQALKIIAWNFYDEGKIGQDYQSNKFTRQEILRVVKENREKLPFLQGLDGDKAVEDLATRSILIEEKGLNFGVNTPVIRFAHKSFLEYLVASHLNDAILGKPEEMKDSFSRIISQEVAQFLKGYVMRINQDRGLTTRTVNTCIDAYNLNQQSASGKSERKRIASSQMSYHMGHINSPRIFDFLSKQLDKENDLLVKRSIIIGLSFSGHKEYLNHYVDRLRQTRNAQLENEINIGNHLAYFGDQPYDDLNPAEDQLIPTCKHTVEKLIYQLGTEINSGSWRLDLFTLLDIGKFRNLSRMDFIDTMKTKLDEFKSIIDNLKSDPISREWPEIADAEQLISCLKSGDMSYFKIC